MSQAVLQNMETVVADSNSTDTRRHEFTSCSLTVALLTEIIYWLHPKNTVF
jgi:hypothetical protein